MQDRRHNWLIYFTSFVNNGTLWMLRPLLPLYADAHGLGYGLIGLVMGSYSVLGLVLAVPGGTLLDRYGARRVFMYSSLLLSGGWMLVALHPAIATFFISQLSVGVGSLLVVVGCQTALTGVNDPQTRETSFAYYTMAASIGQLVGPLLGGPLADWGGYPITMATGALLNLSILPAAWLMRSDRRPAPPPAVSAPAALSHAGAPAAHPPAAHPPAAHPPGERARMRWLLGNDAFRLAWLSSFLGFFAQSTTSTLLPLFLKSLGHTNTFIAATLSLQSVSSLFCRTILGGAVDRLGRFWVLIIALVLGSVATAGFPLAGTSIALVAVLAVFSGGGFGLVQPLSMAITADVSPAGSRGLAMGMRQTGNRAAYLVNPIILGYAAQWVGFTFALYFGSAILTLGLVPVFALRRGLIWPRDLPLHRRAAT